MSKKEKSNQGSENKLLSFKKVINYWNLIPEKLKTPILFAAILLLIIIFYSPVIFSDKTIQSMDVLQNKAQREYTSKEKDGFTLWNPHVYCGIPAYATSVASRTFDLTAYAYSMISKAYALIGNDYSTVYTFSFLIMSISAFLFMRMHGAGREISIFTSAGMIFSTGIVSLFFLGHTTKLVSLSIIPFLLLFFLKFQKEIKLIDFLLLVIALHIILQLAQIQIVFYTGLTFLVAFVFYFLIALIKRDKIQFKQLSKILGVFTIAFIISFLMSYDIYSQLYEYKQYSTRGTEIQIEGDGKSDKFSDSELYKYNTNWSYSPSEMITFIIPSYYGFGSTQYKGEITHGEEQEVNTYFGQMELVNTPMYMGIIILLLGLFALYSRIKEPFVMMCGFIIIFFLLISFGRNLPFVYDLMYKYFPFFKSFRVPSMILHIIQILLPILAGLGIIKIIEMTENNDTRLLKFTKYGFFASIILLLVSINQENFLGNWFFSRIEAAAVDNSDKSKMLLTFAGHAVKMFLSDVHTLFIILSIFFLTVWLFISKKIQRIVFVAIIIIVSMVDLIRIATRGSVYLERESIDELFQYQKQITAIKKQQDKEPFRIVDMRQNGLGSINFNNGFYTYFLMEDVAGYSAIKPKTYDDIIKNVGLNNLIFWKMANVKYVISDFPIHDPDYKPIYSSDEIYAFRYLKALPRAYMVDSVAEINEPKFYLGLQKGLFDPAKVAFVDKLDFNIDKPDSTAKSKIVQYRDENIKLLVNSSGNNFLVFATTYMPIGWKALIDGAETKIIKTNHTFMGIVVPKGKHNVEFIYSSHNFYIGKYLSLVLNLLVIGALIIILIYNRQRQKKMGKNNSVEA